MTPAQRRLAAANAIDAAGNAAAIAETRLACLPHAAVRLASEVIDGHEFAYKLPGPRHPAASPAAPRRAGEALRPPLARGV